MTDFRNIVWVSNFRYPNQIASIRFMATMPAAHLGGRVCVFEKNFNAASFIKVNRPEVLILTKHVDDSLLRLATHAKSVGVPIISVFCDWHFDNEQRVRIDSELCKLSDAVVVQTPQMNEAVEKHFGKAGVIIDEPYFIPRIAPRFSSLPGVVKLFWCGHPSNFDTLPYGLQQISRLSVKHIQLEIMSIELPPASLYSQVTWRAPVNYICTPFSIEAQKKSMAKCDFVIIPSLAIRTKLIKPANRLVAAIQSGRFAVAHPLPSYLELADYCWCGDDLREGIEWALDHPSEAIARIEKGQTYVESRFSLEAVCARWKEVISSVRRSPT
jgi:glycosyltransferase involved in cell wall biosynthesis